MKIGLVLSGGGALGAAHIGALEEIEKNNMKIDSICGTSAGAIIGLLYSYGGLNAINKFFSEMEKAGLFNKTKIIIRRNTSIFCQIEEILKSIVKVKGFADLKINFSCVATDITNGKMEAFSLGDPIKSVMASSAYPGVFPVQRIGNKFYVDGGVIKNLPTSVLKKKNTDFIIGSSLYKIDNFNPMNASGDFKANPLSIAIRSLEIMERQLAEFDKTSCDFCFEPPVHSFRWYDFDAMDEIRKIGAENAANNINQLLEQLKVNHKSRGFFERLFGQ